MIQYAGFTYYKLSEASAINTTADTNAILTNANVQSLTVNQPTFLRRPGVMGFDLFSLRFACAYQTPALRDALVFPSCLISVACQPMPASPTVPNGHRPVKPPMIQQYFKFVGNYTTSTKNSTKEDVGYLILLPSSFQTAIFSTGFENLDHCYLVVEQTSDIPSLGQSAIGSAALLINDVQGFAKRVNCSNP